MTRSNLKHWQIAAALITGAGCSFQVQSTISNIYRLSETTQNT